MPSKTELRKANTPASMQPIPFWGNIFARKLILLALTVFLFTSCDDDRQLSKMLITSPSFGDGEIIPDRHTCRIEQISPALYFHNAPKDTVQFAVIVDDYDSPEGLTTHWLLWNIDGASPHIPQDIKIGFESGGYYQGMADDGNAGYFAPCPPSGETHRYHFRVFALKADLGVLPGASRFDVLPAVEKQAIAYGELVGIVD